jgi:hypothetical protein
VVGIDIKLNQMEINMQEQIVQLKAELQKAVNERNSAWFQLEEAGITINTVEANDDVPYVIIESDSGLTLEGEQHIRGAIEQARSTPPEQATSRMHKR